MNTDDVSGLPPEAFAAALASMPSMGPARLRALLADEPPAIAWERAAHESGASVRDVARVWQRHTSLGIRMLLAGQPAYPERLEDDPQAPALLFCLGDPAALCDAPTVALVGTPRRRRAMGSAWPRSSAPTSPQRASAWCPGWLWVSTVLRTRAPAASVRRPSAWLPADSTIPIRGGTSGCGSGWPRRVSSCPSPRLGCRPRSGAFRSATASWPR